MVHLSTRDHRSMRGCKCWWFEHKSDAEKLKYPKYKSLLVWSWMKYVWPLLNSSVSYIGDKRHATNTDPYFGYLAL